MERRPRPASATTLLPTLATVLAAQGCETPVCGDTPSDEVRRHGPDAIRLARSGQGAEAAREVAVALGLRGHTATRVDVAGAAPITRAEPPIAAPGEAPEVTSVPPQAPEGGIRPVQTDPPNLPRPGGLRPTRVDPPQVPQAPQRPQIAPRPRHISGGAPAVRPHRDDPDL